MMMLRICGLDSQVLLICLAYALLLNNSDLLCFLEDAFFDLASSIICVGNSDTVYPIKTLNFLIVRKCVAAWLAGSNAHACLASCSSHFLLRIEVRNLLIRIDWRNVF